MHRLNFSELEFHNKVIASLNSVRAILDVTRNPEYPSEVHHNYEDKFLLAEFLTNSTIASHYNSLAMLGVSDKVLRELKEWSNQRTVTLRLSAEEQCKFLREETKEVESATKIVTQSTFDKKETFTVTKVTEYFWSFTAAWELSVFAGVDTSKRIVLQSRIGGIELKTAAKQTPRPVSVVRPNQDLDITWLLQNLDANLTPTFHINRTSKQCKTPRRNPEIAQSFSFASNFHSWATVVAYHFTSTIFPVQVNHGLDLNALNSNEIFVPVIPVFEKPASEVPGRSSKIPPVFMSAFLGEQARSLDVKLKNIAKVFPADTKLISVVEAKVTVILMFIKQVNEAYSEAMDYIEDMLLKQLVAAIGKHVTSEDFAKYLTFHNRKIFKPQYRPQPFCYAIRRPEHYPEGTLSLESGLDPVSTIVSRSTSTRPMKFSINAATEISFFGDRYLHGYVSHKFADETRSQLNLCARARQFSSFILLVGRIVSADEFDPKHAIIIQNKDDLKIPLLLETIPTPKEFKDAIASLSPEQQRFCKAFRSMQLESTLFGVCVIQIKPQLEKLLKLPEDSLTKEIQLNQDLLTLFIKYQIPSDLLSYDGPEEEPTAKIERVKDYVARMHSMLNDIKKNDLDVAFNEQDMRRAQPSYDPFVLSSPSTTTTASLFGASHFGQMPQAMPMMGMGGMAAGYPQPTATTTPAFSFAPASMPHQLQQQQMLLQQQAQSQAANIQRHQQQLQQQQLLQLQQLPQYAQLQSQQDHVFEAHSPTQTRSPQQAPQASTKAPQPQQVSPQQKEIARKEQQQVTGEPEQGIVDYTKIPIELERSFDLLDENNALRPTILNTGPSWSKTFQKNLLSKPEDKSLSTKDQDEERDKAFDLLDALTKSGALTIDSASLHVVIASTHCFDKNIINTVIQDNINPIEKVESSALIVASTIHKAQPAQLIAGEHLERIRTTSRLLFSNDPNKNLMEF